MSGHRPVSFAAAVLFGLGMLATCRLDEAGLGQTPGGTATGAAGALAGAAGGGAAGSAPMAGAAGTGAGGHALAGSGGSNSGAAGAAGAGAAGDTGAAGAVGPTGGAGTSGAAGAAGTTGIAGASGAAGTGQSGMSGMSGTSGAAGTTGAAGSTGAAGHPGCGTCPACFRCFNDACEVDPSSAWTVRCVSASIAPTKPSGATWDTNAVGSPATMPDAFCELLLEDGRSRETQVIQDSLMPVWNASVTPISGAPLTAKVLTTAMTRWRISVFDQDSNGDDAVCSTLPVPTTADLAKGSLVLSSVGSCTKLTLGFVCAP